MISSSLRISLALVLYGTSLMGDEFEVTADFLQMDYMERDTLGYKLDGEKTRGIAGFSISQHGIQVMDGLPLNQLCVSNINVLTGQPTIQVLR